jgi:hypothetical protein
MDQRKRIVIVGGVAGGASAVGSRYEFPLRDGWSVSSPLLPSIPLWCCLWSPRSTAARTVPRRMTALGWQTQGYDGQPRKAEGVFGERG